MSRPDCIEGIHFYWEKGKVVFTERFLLERGYCCSSGCRHCPYRGGKKPTPPEDEGGERVMSDE